MDINICSCLQWLCCATKSSGSTWGPPGNWGECWLPPFWYHLEKGIL